MRLSRRSLLRLSGASMTGLLVVACAPAAAPAAPTSAPKPTAAPAVPAASPAAPAAAAPAASPVAAAPAVVSSPAAAAPAAAASPVAAASPASKPAAGGPPPAPDLTAWEAELPKGPVTVNFWHGTDATTNKLYTETFIAGYKQLRPNYTIAEEVVPNLDQKLLVSLATDTAPDMFTNNLGTLQTFISKNAVDPVPAKAWGAASTADMLKAYYLPNVMDVLSRDGSLYGIPNQMNASSMMINIRLFKEAGLDPVNDAPKTWEDVIKLNGILTKKDAAGRIIQKGYDYLWARADQTSSSLQLLIRQAGGEILQDGNIPVFNSEAGVLAMQTFKRVSIDPKVTQVTTASPIQDFATEQNAMHIMGPNGATFTEFVNPNMKGNIVFRPLPQIYPDKPFAAITAFSLVVNTKSADDKKKVAHDFIRYMALQPEVWLKGTGQLTPLASLETSPTAKEIMPFIDVALGDLKIAQQATRTDFASQLDTALKAACERVIFENQDPKAALDQAAAEFTQSIKQ